MADESKPQLNLEDRAKRAERMAREGAQAKAEADAAIIARDANTARLKALRLERDKIEAETVVEAKPVTKARRTKKAT